MTELEAAILKLRGSMDRLDRSVGTASTRSVARADGVRAQASAIERLAAENARLRSARESERALRIEALGEVDAAIAALELAVGDSVADMIAQEMTVAESEAAAARDAESRRVEDAVRSFVRPDLRGGADVDATPPRQSRLMEPTSVASTVSADSAPAARGPKSKRAASTDSALIVSAPKRAPSPPPQATPDPKTSAATPAPQQTAPKPSSAHGAAKSDDEHVWPMGLRPQSVQVSIATKSATVDAAKPTDAPAPRPAPREAESRNG